MKARLTTLLAVMLLCACGQSGHPAASATPTPDTALVSVTAAATTSAAITPAATLPAISYPVATPLTTAGYPAASAVPLPTQTPLPAPQQLTSGGCCVQPFWSPDSSEVRYIDRPASGQPSGIWAVNAKGGAPHFVTERLGLYSPDEKLVAYPESGQTYIERVGGKRWKVPTGGRALLFSPDSTQIAWQVASSTVNFDTRQVQIWVAAVDGSGARKVVDLVGGGLNTWFPDSRRLLVTARADDQSQIEILNLVDGSQNVIAKAPRFQGMVLSPAGNWVAYTVAFSGDPGQDGLYVLSTNGQVGSRLDTFGAYAWKSEGRLLLIPLEPNSPSNRVLVVHANTGFTVPLTDPVLTPFQIAAGNWALSPDGRRLAYVSAADHNLWVLDLPE